MLHFLAKTVAVSSDTFGYRLAVAVFGAMCFD